MTKETVARYLENGCMGRKNVVGSRELERALGISGNELRRKINRLRQEAVPVRRIGGGITMRRRQRRSMPPSEASKRCAVG